MRRALNGLFPGRWAQRKTLVGQGNYLESDETNSLWSIWWQEYGRGKNKDEAQESASHLQ